MTDPHSKNDGPTAPGGARVPHPEGRRSFERLIAFFGILFVFTIAFMLYQSWQRTRGAIGDGSNVESYGFDLANFTGDPDALVTSGRSKDFLQVLGRLSVVDVDQMDELKEIGPKAVTPAVLQVQADRTFKGWRRLVVSGDDVIGVVVNGEARAYPIRYIRWHEIINDVLGDTPIAVTYSILSDTAVVFDRRVGGETLNFGFSGLLYSGNLLMYDIRPDVDPASIPRDTRNPGANRYTRARAAAAGESLWSQLRFGPIAGPAVDAGSTLTVIPMWYGKWGDWLELHPDSTVFAGDRRQADAYKIQPEGLPWQTGVFDLPLVRRVPDTSPLEPTRAIRVLPGDSGPIVRPESDDAQTPPDAILARTRWYVWYALHGDEGVAARD